MAYLSGDDSLYSGSTTPEEFGSYPFPRSQTLPTLEGGASTFNGSSIAVDQPGPPAAALASHLATINYGEGSSRLVIGLGLTHKPLGSLYPVINSHPAALHGFRWSTIGQSTRLGHTDASSRNPLFLGGREGDAAMQAQIFDCGEYHSGL